MSDAVRGYLVGLLLAVPYGVAIALTAHAQEPTPASAVHDALNLPPGCNVVVHELYVEQLDCPVCYCPHIDTDALVCPKPGDMDGDGVVGFEDLVLFHEAMEVESE